MQLSPNEKTLVNRVIRKIKEIDSDAVVQITLDTLEHEDVLLLVYTDKPTFDIVRHTTPETVDIAVHEGLDIVVLPLDKPAPAHDVLQRYAVRKRAQDIVDQPRNIVVVVIVGQAATEGNGAYREHRPAVGGLKIHHIGTDELCSRDSGPGGEEAELFLVHENEIFWIMPL